MRCNIFIHYLNMTECFKFTIKFTISAFVFIKKAIIGQIWELGIQIKNNFVKTPRTNQEVKRVFF